MEPNETKAAFARFGAAQKKLDAVDFSQSKGQHVLAGEIRDPQAVAPMVERILSWVKTLPTLMNIQPNFQDRRLSPCFLRWSATTQAQAQLTSPLIGCGPVFAGSSFTVQFKGETATLNYKDDVHSIEVCA